MLDHGENTTLSIDLSMDWTNRTLNLISTPRLDNSQPMNFQNLWWSKHDGMIYCFGGEVWSGSQTPPESIWGFLPDGHGGGIWTEIVGPTAAKSFPPQILRPAGGASAYDDESAYYLGGFASPGTSIAVHLDWGQTRPAPGFLEFDFSSRTLSNSSNDGSYFASIYIQSQGLQSGVMLDVPSFGHKGILLVIGGGDFSGGQQANFNNITIFDKDKQKWHSQSASGDIPDPKRSFCAVGVQGGDNSTYEM